MWWLLRCNLERSHPWGAAQRVLVGSPKSWGVAVGAQMVCSSFSICLSILLLPFGRIELSEAYKPCPKALVKIDYRHVKNSYCWIIPETTKSLNYLFVCTKNEQVTAFVWGGYAWHSMCFYSLPQIPAVTKICLGVKFYEKFVFSHAQQWLTWTLKFSLQMVHLHRAWCRAGRFRTSKGNALRPQGLASPCPWMLLSPGTRDVAARAELKEK